MATLFVDGGLPLRHVVCSEWFLTEACTVIAGDGFRKEECIHAVCQLGVLHSVLLTPHSKARALYLLLFCCLNRKFQ